MDIVCVCMCDHLGKKKKKEICGGKKNPYEIMLISTLSLRKTIF